MVVIRCQIQPCAFFLISCSINMERFLALLVVFWSSAAYLSINDIAVEARPRRLYNVMSYGATGNGQTDDSQGFLKAWKATCKDRGDKGTPVMYVPHGKKFLLSPTCFKGPCNSNSVHVQVLGSIVAPHSRSGWKKCTSDSWLSFINVAGLIVQGSGSIDGQGSIWWKGGKQSGSCHWPTALYFQNCDKLVLTGLHHMNSPRAHIGIDKCNHVKLSYLTITAPKSSPNTDGIDIAGSRYLTLHNLHIRTGDDCIAINGNSAFINITGVFCGPGHGISVGSLGRYHSDVVEEVHVRNCTFTNTLCGARIKTWQNGLGHARRISFEDITLNAAGSPIIIDQLYGDPHNSLQGVVGVGVAVRDVTYKGFRGTSSTEKAIELRCEKNRGCSGIKMDNVHITSSSPGKKVVSFCKNASGRATNTSPRVPCLRG